MALNQEALVEYDYEAQHTDELSIRVGDTVTDLTPTEPGWMRGKLRGKVGVFPDNFVKMVHRDVAKPKPKLAEPTGSLKINGVPKRPPGRRRCRALFSYAPEKADELELKLHDVIDVLEEVEPGWWKGSLNGKVGVFPSNFVEELPPAEPEPIQEIKPKPVKGVGLGDILKDAKARPPPHLAKPPDPAVDAPAPQLPPKPVKELCKALFAYTRQNEDELTLKEGDVITIVSKESEDKGWWRGELNGKVGVFPDNFVEVVSSTEQKPARPEKPAGKPSSARPTETEKSEPAVKPASADSVPRPTLPQPPAAGLRLHSQEGVADEPTSSLPRPASSATKPLLPTSKASSPPPVGLRADGIASMLANAAAAAAAAVNSRNSNTSPPALPKTPPPKLPSPKSTSPKPSLLPAKPVTVLPKPALPATNPSVPDTNMSHPAVLADTTPASQPDGPRRTGKPDGDTSLEEFDAVERGPDRLTHITADRARVPGRRPPSTVFSRESMSPRSPVSPASPLAPNVSEEPELTNGAAESTAPASPSAPAQGANAAPPWMRELQRAQNKRISRLAETDDDKLERTSGEEADATVSSAHAPSAAPPWMRELQRNHIKKQMPATSVAAASRDEENASGDSRQASEDTDSAASSTASVPTTAPPAVAAASAKPARPDAPADAVKPRKSVLRGGAAKPVETPPPRPMLPAAVAATAAPSKPSDDKDASDQVALLQRQLTEQGRQFQEALTALRADYQKRMRTVLDELDAEKKARLVMQVQLDRLDKLVKDMNFTV